MKKIILLTLCCLFSMAMNYHSTLYAVSVRPYKAISLHEVVQVIEESRHLVGEGCEWGAIGSTLNRLAKIYGRMEVLDQQADKFDWLVTREGGALDLDHFFSTAVATFKDSLDRDHGTMHRQVLNTFTTFEQEEHFVNFEAEDLPSNALGTCFGIYLRRLVIEAGGDQSKVSVAQAFTEFTEVLKPYRLETEGEEARHVVSLTRGARNHSAKPFHSKKIPEGFTLDSLIVNGKRYELMFTHPRFCPKVEPEVLAVN